MWLFATAHQDEVISRINTVTESSPPDLRWKQRFSNYQKAKRQLADAVQLSGQRPLTQLEQQGLIKVFEFTQELASNVMKDYFEYQGNTSITGSRDALHEAFNEGLINDGEGWMDTIKSRNRSSHTYEENTAQALARIIVERYMGLFEAFTIRMRELGADDTNH